MREFTGERVLPGQVEVDLWNEHLTRYAFAAHFAKGARVLDLGCGSGYGSARLATVAFRVYAADISHYATVQARAAYPGANLTFFTASCTDVPLASATFDLVVAFEVIEHVAAWQKLLDEARRLLAPGGLFILSTPNKVYYEKSRGASGPNPYHVHEFAFGEFRVEVGRVFPCAAFFLQNHVDGFVFQPLGSPVSTGEEPDAEIASQAGNPDEASFFLAVCGMNELPVLPPFVYIPKSANILRERELHIEALQQELETKDGWLAEARSEKQNLVEMFRDLGAELEERNRWAAELDSELNAARERIAALQQELADQQTAYKAKIAELEEECRKQTEWALETAAELRSKCDELAECVRLLDRAEATVAERTVWARGLEAQLEQAKGRLAMASASRWVRLGRAVGLGPELSEK